MVLTPFSAAPGRPKKTSVELWVEVYWLAMKFPMLVPCGNRGTLVSIETTGDERYPDARCSNCNTVTWVIDDGRVSRRIFRRKDKSARVGKQLANPTGVPSKRRIAATEPKLDPAVLVVTRDYAHREIEHTTASVPVVLLAGSRR